MHTLCACFFVNFCFNMFGFKIKFPFVMVSSHPFEFFLSTWLVLCLWHKHYGEFVPFHHRLILPHHFYILQLLLFLKHPINYDKNILFVMVNGGWWPKINNLWTPNFWPLHKEIVPFIKMELKVVLMFIWMTLTIFQNALIVVGINIKLPMDAFFDEQQIVNIHFEG